MLSDFNKRLKILREKKGLSQSQLAKIIGVSTTTIQNYEYGKIPKTEHAIALANLFNVSLDWFLLGKECEKNNEKKGNNTPEYTPYEMLLAEILHRIGYYEHDFTPEQLATLTNTVEKEVKGTLWDLQNKIFALIRQWKK